MWGLCGKAKLAESGWPSNLDPSHHLCGLVVTCQLNLKLPYMTSL